MDDFISREDTIEKMEEVDWYHQNKNGEMVHGANPAEHQAWYKAEDVYKVLEDMPSAQPERKISNKEWIDFLVFQFEISRTSAKEMLHGMMQWKKEDNFKKQFRGKQDG